MMESAPLYDLVFSVEKYQDAYRAYIDLLSRYWFNPQNLSPMIQKYHNMIAPYVTQSTGDKAFYGEQSMFPLDAFQNSADELKNFVTQRSAYIQSALEQE